MYFPGCLRTSCCMNFCKISHDGYFGAKPWLCKRLLSRCNRAFTANTGKSPRKVSLERQTLACSLSHPPIPPYSPAISPTILPAISPTISPAMAASAPSPTRPPTVVLLAAHVSGICGLAHHHHHQPTNQPTPRHHPPTAMLPHSRPLSPTKPPGALAISLVVRGLAWTHQPTHHLASPPFPLTAMLSCPALPRPTPALAFKLACTRFPNRLTHLTTCPPALDSRTTASHLPFRCTTSPVRSRLVRVLTNPLFAFSRRPLTHLSVNLSQIHIL